MSLLGATTGYKMVTYPPEEIEDVAEASEENVKRIGGTVSRGIAGAAILGPVADWRTRQKCDLRLQVQRR